ncbi:hypothetical protein BDA99DRAFT_576654 [Phascolomyces articulosus]|uniref:Uncharacterized protein n=1 Tax=Phascolomyces articulosus TaxID=60185 RepID=A0AAD5P820_9FUNG|nr:hypothetical protein BDA99DRAFT_576654 [Phascolomyces articulosus]
MPPKKPNNNKNNENNGPNKKATKNQQKKAAKKPTKKANKKTKGASDDSNNETDNGHTTREQCQFILEWLEVPYNFQMITGQISAFIPGSKRKYTKTDGFKGLQEYMQSKGTNWSLEQVKGRLRKYKDKYMKARDLTKNSRGSSGAGVDITDSRSFMMMLEEVCPFYERMHILYGERQDIEPETLLEAGQGRIVVYNAPDPASLIPQPLQQEEVQERTPALPHQRPWELEDYDHLYHGSNEPLRDSVEDDDEVGDSEDGDEDEDDDDEDEDGDDDSDSDEEDLAEKARRGFETSFKNFSRKRLRLDKRIMLLKKKQATMTHMWEHERREKDKVIETDRMKMVLQYLPPGLEPEDIIRFKKQLFEEK